MFKHIKKLINGFNHVTKQKKVKPPQAKKIPHDIEQFGETRTDHYHWMRDENWQEVLKDPNVLNPEIRQYLEDENAYKDDQFKSVKGLTKAIGDELASRVVPDEASVPLVDGDWVYWFEYKTGGDYPVHMRRHSATGQKQVLFDGDKEANGHEFFDLAAFKHSPDQKYIAYAVDVEGSEYYQIRIRDIETGQEFESAIQNSTGGFQWSADSKTLYYTEQDDHHRAKKVKGHTIGTETSEDVEIYHEPDDMMFLKVSKSESGDYIFIQSGNSEVNEVQFFDSNAGKAAAPQVIKPRENGLRYEVHHHDNTFYIHTDKDGATEFKLMSTPVDAYTEEHWQDVIPARDDVTMEEVILFKDYMVRQERKDGVQQIIIADYQGKERSLEFPDAAFAISVSQGFEFDSDTLRVHYRTMANPGITYDVDMKTGDKTVLKERKLPNGHDPSEYVIEYLSVKADDGVDIPVTILRHKSVKADGSAPLFQYGYGSYGATMDAGFSSNAISLVDRGLVYAIAHIRGGGEKGEAWYEDGKKMAKKNTFTDFIKVTEALVDKGYGKKGEVIMQGGSAGGMLMGAVVNMRPDLYGAVIAAVPFVDVLNTISDATLPLTPPEWEEWGNPIKDKTAYGYMKSYSPYENIQKGVTYPLIVAPAGLTDPRVTYWEPAKWIARLRDEAKGGPFLLKMNMGSGHFGATSRYEQAKERADEYAMVLKTLVDKGYDLSLRVDYKSKKPGPKTPKNPKTS